MATPTPSGPAPKGAGSTAMTRATANLAAPKTAALAKAAKANPYVMAASEGASAVKGAVSGGVNATAKAGDAVADTLKGKSSISGVGVSIIAIGLLTVWLAVKGETLPSFVERKLRPTYPSTIRKWDGTSEAYKPPADYTTPQRVAKRGFRVNKSDGALSPTTPASPSTTIPGTPTSLSTAPGSRVFTTRFDTARGSVF